MAPRGGNEDVKSNGSGRTDNDKRIEKRCRYCDSSFSIPKCRDWRNHYCSSECGKLHRKENKEKRRTECPACGENFIARNSQLKNGRKPYCSIGCITRGKKHTEERKAKTRATYKAGNHKHPKGKDHPGWKGGVSIIDGYYRYSSGEHIGRNVHTVMMEKKIGRRLTKNEVVHHINHDPLDNRIENLQLMTRAEHIRHHLHGD